MSEKMVIAIASAKGGAGKSTLAQIMAQVLTKHGQRVTIIDADPNRPQVSWRAGRSAMAFSIIADVTENNVVRHVNAIDEGYVLIDLEGVGSRLVSRAIAKADLVVIPIQPSGLDANEAGKTINLILEEQEVLEREIPFKVVLTRTNPAIRSKIERKITDEMTAIDLPLTASQLNERSAYKAVFVEKVSLYELDPAQVNGIEKAIANAEAVTAEIVN